MHATHHRPPGAWITLGVFVAFSASAGCRPADEITTYRIAKPSGEPSPPAQTATPRERTGEPTDRMLAAIAPGPDQAWFFKAIGPRAALDPASDSIGAFLKSIRFEGAKPTWETPAGWTEQKGGGMRLATLLIPAAEGDDPIELSVIGLSLVDEWDAQVLDNVNRWFGQIGRPPVDADGLAEAVTALDDVAEGAVLLDQTGWFDGGGMPSFAGQAAAPPARKPPPRNELKFETPDGWTDGEVSSMRKASFRTPGGAEVTAFAFAAAGQMGDSLGNANRWRGEVKLAPTTQEELDAESEAMTLLGEPGRYFEFVGPDETTYAAMVVRGDLAWFFKIRGPGDEVAEQREAFRGWLDTLAL